MKSIGPTILFTLAFVVGWCLYPLVYDHKPTPPPPVKAQKVTAEIVSVYQRLNGTWETVLKYEDGTLGFWEERKMGNPGDKFPAWKRGSTYWLQDPDK